MLQTAFNECFQNCFIELAISIETKWNIFKHNLIQFFTILGETCYIVFGNVIYPFVELLLTHSKIIHPQSITPQLLALMECVTESVLIQVIETHGFLNFLLQKSYCIFPPANTPKVKEEHQRQKGESNKGNNGATNGTGFLQQNFHWDQFQFNSQNILKHDPTTLVAHI